MAGVSDTEVKAVTDHLLEHVFRVIPIKGRISKGFDPWYVSEWSLTPQAYRLDYEDAVRAALEHARKHAQQQPKRKGGR